MESIPADIAAQIFGPPAYVFAAPDAQQTIQQAVQQLLAEMMGKCKSKPKRK